MYSCVFGSLGTEVLMLTCPFDSYCVSVFYLPSVPSSSFSLSLCAFFLYVISALLSCSRFPLSGWLFPRPYGLEEDVRQYEQDLAKRLYQSRVRASLDSAAAPPSTCSSSSQPRSALPSHPALWGLSSGAFKLCFGACCSV